jgi:RNA polymerase sigma-70 factor (ECF subfamily)
LNTNEPGAREELLKLTHDRLLAMIRGLLSRYPNIRRWEESDDILQNVHVRLLRCLDQVSIGTARDFLSLAATNMRRELIDLSRHYYGSEGSGKNHATPSGNTESDHRVGQELGTRQDDPAILAEWAELHEYVAKLPDDEREIMDLHWYHGLSQKETAALLGISVKTVKRRWLAAKAILAIRLGRSIPV